MKKRMLSLLMVLAMLCTLLPSGMLMASAAETINIVCVGDSLTAGSGSTNWQHYPNQLQSLLGSDYSVINKGLGGRTMGDNADGVQYTYKDAAGNLTGNGTEAQVDEATIASADYIVIMLGTNDGKYWTLNNGVSDEADVTNFTTAYNTMLDTFMEWNPTAHIVLASPPTSQLISGGWGNPTLAAIGDEVEKVYTAYAAANPGRFTFIDIKALTEGWEVDHPLEGKEPWYADTSVHFNNDGYAQLAKLYYEKMWDNTVKTFTVDGLDTKLDQNMGTLYVAGDVTGKTGTITVAEGATANTTVELVNGGIVPVTNRDGIVRNYTVCVTDEKADFDKKLIYNADQFKALQGQELEGDYKLMANVDLGTVAWNPIVSLDGTFDGNGFTVTMNGTVSASDYGLFKSIKAGSVLKNLTLAGTVDANVKNNVGGFVFENRGLVQDCVNTATISNGGNGNWAAFRSSVAGIVSVNYGMVDRCGNTGVLSGKSDYVCGIAGALEGSGVVANCYNTGAITVTGNGAAGIVGVVSSGAATTAVVNCYNTGDITSVDNGQLVAGILSNANQGGGTTLTNVWNTGAINTTNVGRNEICVRNSMVTASNTFNSAAVAADTLTKLNANLMVGVKQGEDLYSLYSWVEGPAFGELVTAMPQDADGTYHLMNRDHFDWWVNAVKTDNTIKVKLECDIDLTGKWTPIATLAGSFDGGNHTISGLTIDATTNNQGFVAELIGGTLKNINFTDVSITSTGANVGAAVGRVQYGTVSGITVSGSISVTRNGGGTNVGGIVGTAGGSNKVVTIENCVNNATVTISHTDTADKNVGGILGQGSANTHGDSVIKNCVNNAAITGQNDSSMQTKKIAGIAGEAYFSVINCQNHGAITGYGDVGGIVGVSYNGNNPDVEGNYDWHTYIANCYNTAQITAGGVAGGVVARVNMYSHMVNCYTLGNMGVFNSAHTPANCVNNYYCNTTATANRMGTGKTTAEMQSANFARDLNNFVIENKDDEVLGGFGLFKWEKGENSYPVLTGKVATADDVVDNSTLIETVAQLLAISGSNGTFTLVNDLTVTAEDVAANTNTFVVNGFGGTFDGNGHIITIACNRMFINALNKNGVLKNLTIDGTMDFGEGNEMAGVVKDLYGTIDNVEFAGSITSTKARIGGFAMNMWQGAVIRNSTFSGSITAPDSIAGFAVRSYGTNSADVAPALIENCVTTATAKLEATASGTVNLGGFVFSSQSNLTIRNSVNNASLVANNTAGNRDNIGGIVAHVNATTTTVIDGCTNNGTIGAGNATGGIVGNAEIQNTATQTIKLIITNCVNAGAVNGLSYTGGIAGRVQGGVQLYVINCANTGSISGSGSAIVGVLRNGGSIGYVYNNYSTKSGWGDVGEQGTAHTINKGNNYMNVNGGTTVATMQTPGFLLELDSYVPSAEVQAVLTEQGITLRTWDAVIDNTPILGKEAIGAKGGIKYDADGAFLIGNDLQLSYFAVLATANPALSAKMTADVTLTANWARIEKDYTGTFDGCGYTISGFKQEGNVNPGFIMNLGAAGVIKNLTIEGNIYTPAKADFGAFVGKNYGRLINLTNRVNIANPEMERDGNGRIVEDMQGGMSNIGGVAGHTYGGAVIDSCRNEAAVVSNADRAGGIVGYTANNSLVINCVNAGEVVHVGASSGTGGIVGGVISANDKVYVMNCANLGPVYDNNGHRGYIGGVMGDGTNTTTGNSFVINSYNASTEVWYKQSSEIGGIGSRGVTVIDCYTQSDVLVNPSHKANGNKMPLADMKLTSFADTLNNNIRNLDATYQTVLDNAGVSLKYWTQTEGELPVHIDGVTVIFKGRYNEQIAEKLAISPAELADLLTNTKAPALGGYVCNGWSEPAEDAELLFFSNANGSLVVTAAYELNATPEFTVTLTGATAVAGGDVTVESGLTELTFDQRVTVTAQPEEGQTISYWLLDGAKVGFGQSTYTFYMGGKTNIEAVYDVAVDTLEPEVVIQQTTYSADNGRFNLTVIAQTSVPSLEGVTDLAYGVYYTATEAAIQNLPDGGAFIQVISSKTEANQQYMTHLLSVAQNRTRYARAYMVIDGVTYYSNQYVKYVTGTDTVAIETFTVQ